jgi:N-acetylmuramoyl-L-alanine amidase
MINKEKKNFWRFVLLFTICFQTVNGGWATKQRHEHNDVSMRIGNQPNGIRIVLECKAPPKAGVYQGNKNKTLLINVLNGLLRPSSLPENTLISQLKIEPLGQNKSQVIIETKKPVKIIKQFTLSPSKDNKNRRLVIDLKSEQSHPIQPSILQTLSESKKSAVTKSVSAASPSIHRKKTIIIDAGHGGGDPGTIGQNGTYEKNVTLKCATLLANALKKTNRYNVRMTRSTDVFIPLKKRVQFSRENHGDLFISLHADSSPRKSARGLSVYTLSRIASDKEAARLAQKENKADLFMGINFDMEVPEVANILIDLTKRETMNLSVAFAQMIKSACDQKLLFPGNAHRFANFAVLRTPDIPGVLIELGFLSNPQDEKLLKQENYLKKISSAIVNAIDTFFLDKQATG